MQHFLDAPVIYPDPAFRALFEDVARANIAREIASLA
jgi:predicted metal-dependent HD superfamily phosphohydrolase